MAATKAKRQKPKGKKSTGNSPAKLGRPKPALIKQKHGGALHAGGVPGNKGGTGRPPNWLRDFCDDLLASDTTKAQVRAILSDASHPAFAAMWGRVSDRAHGKPLQAVAVSATPELLAEIVALSQSADDGHNV